MTNPIRSHIDIVAYKDNSGRPIKRFFVTQSKKVTMIKIEHLDSKGNPIFCQFVPCRGDQTSQGSSEYLKGLKLNLKKLAKLQAHKNAFSLPCLEIQELIGRTFLYLRLPSRLKRGGGKAWVQMCRVRNNHHAFLASSQEVFLMVED